MLEFGTFELFLVSVASADSGLIPLKAGLKFL